MTCNSPQSGINFAFEKPFKLVENVYINVVIEVSLMRLDQSSDSVIKKNFGSIGDKSLNPLFTQISMLY